MIIKSANIRNYLCRYLFSTIVDMQGKKKIDYNKASIKMMLQSSIHSFDTDSMVKSKQFYLHIANRIFLTKNSVLSFGEFAFVLDSGKFVSLQIPGCFQKLMQSINLFWFSQDLQKHRLHQPIKLKKALNLIVFIEQNSRWITSRYFSAFLGYYIQNCKLMKSSQIQTIMMHLTQRLYYTEFMIEYIDKMFANIPEITSQSATKSPDFNQICRRINILNSVIQAKNKKHLGQNQIKDAQKLIIEYQKQYFAFFQGQIKLQEIIEIDSSLWIQDFLFTDQNKNSMFKIIKKVLDPTRLYRINIEQSLFTNLFDKLYLHSSFKDIEHVFEILQKTKQLFALFGEASSFILPPSLILLCQKFNYTSKTMANYFYNEYLRKQLLPKRLHYPSSIKKNKALNRIILLSNCHLLAVCEEVYGQINPQWRNIFLQKFQSALELNLTGFPGIQGYIFQKNFIEARQKIQTSQLSRSFYRLTGQFYLEDSSKFNQTLLKVQRQLGSKFNPKYIEDRNYPVNIKLNDAARINNLFWNLCYYAEFGNKDKALQIFQSINSNVKIVQQIQDKIGYPKLLEAITRFKMIVWNPTTNNTQSKTSNYLISLIQNQKNRFNSIFSEKVQGNIQNIKQTGFSELYKPFIQYLKKPICKKIVDYSRDQQIQSSIINCYDKFISGKQHHLKSYVMNQMRNFFTKNPRNLNKIKVANNHMDFPFFADCLIMFRGKAITIFIIDNENFEEKQQSIEHFKKHSNVVIIKTKQDVKKIFRALTSSEIYH